MIGGPIGLGIGVPFVTTGGLVQLGALTSDGAATAALTGGSTAAATSTIAGSAPTGFTGQSTANISFMGTSATTFSAAGRTRSLAAFDVTANSGFDFRNVPLLAGRANIHGVGTPAFGGAFSVLPARDAVPQVDAGHGQTSVSAGQARASTRGGAGRKTIKGGRGISTAKSGSVTKNIGL